MRSFLWAVAGAVAFVLATATPAAASTAPGVESGWWYTVSVGPLVPPSAQSADQLQVSYSGAPGSGQPGGFDGTLAFSAVRIPVPAGTALDGTVTLTLSTPNGSSVGTPSVSACPTTGNWTPGPAQPPKSAPGYSCAGGHEADGSIGATGTSWKIPLSWATGGDLSVALVPRPGTTAPFSVGYADPTAASVSFAAAGVVSSAPEPAPSPPPANSSAAAPAGQPAVVNPAVSPPVGPVPAGPVAPAANPAGPSLSSLGSGEPTQAPASTPSSGKVAGAPESILPGGGVAHARPGRGGRILGVVLLAVLAVGMFALSAQPDRPPRLLGPLGHRGPIGQPSMAGGPTGPVGSGGRGAQLGGLGRFARPRSAPPNRL